MQTATENQPNPVVNSSTFLRSNENQSQLNGDQSPSELENEFDCFCCGKKVINASPRIVLAFLITLVLIAVSFVFMFIKGQSQIFVPVLAGIVGFWLPSPLQSAPSRTDVAQQKQLLTSNLRLNSILCSPKLSSIAVAADIDPFHGVIEQDD